MGSRFSELIFGSHMKRQISSYEMLLREVRIGGEERRLINRQFHLVADQFSMLLEGVKERCSGSFHLAVGFLVIKDDSISERPG